MCILHSRYASNKDQILNEKAHPVFDKSGKIGVFHNGFISNFNELRKELYDQQEGDLDNLTDSELIAHMVGRQINQGSTL